MLNLVGTVKFFDARKGFGFISVNEVEYFVHFKEIKMPGYKELHEGQSVRFQAKKGDRGWFATEVLLIGEGVLP